MRITAIFVLTSVLLGAQTSSPAARITAPRLGYAFDERSGAIRLITGIPGAAGVEGALDSPSSLQYAFVAPRGSVALAVLKEGGAAVVRWTSQGTTVAPIDTTLDPSSIVAFDRSGDHAAIAGSGALEVWTNLMDKPALLARYGPDALGGSPAAVAISDDGAWVAVALDTGGIVAISDQVRGVTGAGTWRGLAFIPGSLDLIASDFDGNRIVRIHDLAGDPVIAEIASRDGGILAPGAVGVSGDGLSAVIANTGNQSIARVDLATGAVSAVACNCTPTRFERLEGNAIFRIVDRAAGGLSLFDGDWPSPRITAVPESAGGAQ